MGRRKIEMHEFRKVLIRLRAGDRDREVARLGLMGRVKVGQFRALALSLGWLEPTAQLPDLPTIAQSLATKSSPGARRSPAVWPLALRARPSTPPSYDGNQRLRSTVITGHLDPEYPPAADQGEELLDLGS